ncbi:MAG: TetR/AcrR family transcriptional regulator [Notoacmeibacter sp.]|nr:TetR/AcrR family transcriptional regulator [Notoacmeibacter sp.]
MIDATIDSICEHGFQNATTAEIARRAGVSRGALQHHFRNKADLMLAVLDSICGKFASGVSGIADRHASLEERCDDLVRTLWNIYGSRAYAAAIEVVLGARGDPKTYARVREFRLLSAELAQHHWAEALSDVDVSSERLTAIMHFTVAAMRGFSLHAPPRSDATFYGEQLKLLRTFLVNALRADESDDDFDLPDDSWIELIQPPIDRVGKTNR